jgi:hypothetical protein
VINKLGKTSESSIDSHTFSIADVNHSVAE